MLSDEDRKEIIQIVVSTLPVLTNNQDRLTRLIDVLIQKNVLINDDKIIINNRKTFS